MSKEQLEARLAYADHLIDNWLLNLQGKIRPDNAVYICEIIKRQAENYVERKENV